MSNENTYPFISEAWGHFELELLPTDRGFYEAPDQDKRFFSVKNYGQDQLDSKPFFFYEWQRINYAYAATNNPLFVAPFELRINNRTVKKSDKKGGNHILTGQYCFEDGVGETCLEIRDAANTLIIAVTAEVFPQKMDYKSDFQAMTADISEIIHNLAYDALKDTYRKSRSKPAGHTTMHEWWSILDTMFNDLLSSIYVIKGRAKHGIIHSEKILPVEKIKTASKKNADWLIKNAHYAGKGPEGLKVMPGKYYSHALSGRKQVTYDTYENRFVAWAIKNAIQQLRAYKKHIESLSGAGSYMPLLDKMKTYQGRLQGILHEHPFNEAGTFEKRAYFPESLTRGAGYGDFMRIYLLLSKGLEIINNDIFNIEQKNMSLLYEYWCFLKIVQLLKEQNASKLEYQDLIKVRANKFYVELKKGQESKVTFKKSGSPETSTIYFNKLFERDGKKIFTFSQRPDYTIEFTKKGFANSFWYIMDAKYRFDESAQNNDAAFNAPQDAIGQLHRYRDAILHTVPEDDTYRRAIKTLGGVVLYPYPSSEEQFKENKYYDAIDKFNIGALPFLPGKTGLVDQLLDNMINKMTPEDHFEWNVEMDHAEYVKRRELWKEWVTIGIVQRSEQEARLRFISEKRIFYFPFVKSLHSRLFLTKHLLVCRSDTKEATLYKAKSWEVLSDEELRAMGTTWPHRAEKYLAFHLEAAEKIITPDKITPYGFKYTTKEGLNRYLQNEDHNKSYFYITTPDAARLFDELRNIGIEPKVRWANSNADPSLVEFTFGKGIKVYSSEKYLDLHYKYEEETFSLRELMPIVKKLV